jgi:hypothetical protein
MPWLKKYRADVRKKDYASLSLLPPIEDLSLSADAVNFAETEVERQQRKAAKKMAKISSKKEKRKE